MKRAQDLLLRPASADDLARIWDIRFADEIAGMDPIPEPGSSPQYLAYMLAHGTLLVAERDDVVVGFAGRVDRGGVAYLTDLFVDPAHQSSAVGRNLLQHIFANAPSRRCTMASADYRALALYTRMGMTPRWPHILLQATARNRLDLSASDVEMIPANVDDAELVFWDQACSGRLRPEDLHFYVTRERGQVFWFRRGVETIGYGIVRLGAGNPWRPEAVVVGPLGVGSAEDALVCTLAAVAWAREHGPDIEISVPGRHPALKPLLDAGLLIDDVDTFCATDPAIVDPMRYIGSGGDFF
jgi:GNAT superfamily N-acetyltransferase